MHKAKKELIKTLSSVQAVVEVVDARAPAASTNPLLQELAADKPKLKIMNKADLADRQLTHCWKEYFNSQSKQSCLVTELDKQNISQQIVDALERLSPNANGHIDVSQTCLIVGIPNVGKSTLINAIAGRKAAKTGNEPAVTKGQQRIKLDQHWTLIDSPGMMWPRLEDQRAALCLALTGAIRQTALDIEEIGWLSAELLMEIDANAVLDRYQITEAPESTEQLMEAIGVHVGARNKGGSLNWHKTAEALLNDYRSGKLGRISLEAPPA
ncbi:MAG: ribosome biogenesis GTPase YlqF [Pseudomonadales bacterium]|nr:ribosome biogenesis GTPase YlqF [Pseudomonadales bacterium]